MSGNGFATGASIRPGMLWLFLGLMVETVMPVVEQEVVRDVVVV